MIVHHATSRGQSLLQGATVFTGYWAAWADRLEPKGRRQGEHGTGPRLRSIRLMEWIDYSGSFTCLHSSKAFGTDGSGIKYHVQPIPRRSFYCCVFFSSIYFIIAMFCPCFSLAFNDSPLASSSKCTCVLFKGHDPGIMGILDCRD